MFFKKKKEKPLEWHEVGKGHLLFHLKEDTTYKSKEIKGAAYDWWSNDIRIITAKTRISNELELGGKLGFFKLEDGTYLNADLVRSVEPVYEKYKTRDIS